MSFLLFKVFLCEPITNGSMCIFEIYILFMFTDNPVAGLALRPRVVSFHVQLKGKNDLSPNISRGRGDFNRFFCILNSWAHTYIFYVFVDTHDLFLATLCSPCALCLFLSDFFRCIQHTSCGQLTFSQSALPFPFIFAYSFLFM
jgi:hypothetical protein